LENPSKSGQTLLGEFPVLYAHLALLRHWINKVETERLPATVYLMRNFCSFFRRRRDTGLENGQLRALQSDCYRAR
jgi:hypothetical protein